MELDKKSFSIRRHITLVLTLLTVLIVLLIGVCVAVVREQSRIRLTSAADSYLSLLTRTLENQLVIQESYITSQVLNSEELHRLGFGEVFDDVNNLLLCLARKLRLCVVR